MYSRGFLTEDLSSPEYRLASEPNIGKTQTHQNLYIQQKTLYKKTFKKTPKPSNKKKHTQNPQFFPTQLLLSKFASGIFSPQNRLLQKNNNNKNTKPQQKTHIPNFSQNNFCFPNLHQGFFTPKQTLYKKTTSTKTQNLNKNLTKPPIFPNTPTWQTKTRNQEKPPQNKQKIPPFSISNQWISCVLGGPLTVPRLPPEYPAALPFICSWRRF